MTSVLIACFVLLLILCYYVMETKFKYWKQRNVPYLKPLLIFGNYKEYLTLNKTMFSVVNEIYEQFPNEPYVGAFYGTEPTLILRDPEYIKLVLARDFYYFNSREIAKYTSKEIWTQSLFFTYGDRWKILRQNLTPIFSSAKMKKMFYLIAECSTLFEEVLEKEMQKPKTELRSVMECYTIDCIGSCVFGINTNTMTIKEDNPFIHIAKKLFESTTSRGLGLIGRAVWPKIFYILGCKAFPLEINNFFNQLIKGVFQARNFKESNRHDFVDIMLRFKRNACLTGDTLTKHKDESVKRSVLKIDDDLLCGQCISLFGAGFETSATTLSYILYELAKHPAAQEKAIIEVDEYFRKNEELSYGCASENQYLEACFSETLRIYPLVGVLTRELVEDYVLPSGVSLNKGVRVHVPVYSLHHDADYFPEPEVFRPERFLDKDNIRQYTYMPFGGGPRICIGLRFAKMQVMAGLLTVLRKCRVELADGMPRSLEFEPRAITTQPIQEIHVKLIRR
ncbi:cytochrome P450 6B5-like [Leptidea sinapis]|uniref:cytochrome P450 6B5-like n=1 Tax=Leptidea sinapis TaxID=189913 RepID=UPI0021C4C228|nr:cytochrome P450 6B5-like [Leptidea sinapis]